MFHRFISSWQEHYEPCYYCYPGFTEENWDTVTDKAGTTTQEESLTEALAETSTPPASSFPVEDFPLAQQSSLLPASSAGEKWTVWKVSLGTGSGQHGPDSPEFCF